MACDGSEAVQMVKSSPGKYDMIFMDNLMPNMVRYPLQKQDLLICLICLFCMMFYQSGIDATAALRSDGFRNLIVGLTGSALDDDVAAFESAGADLVLSKPLQVSLLVTLLEHVQDVGVESRQNMRLEVTHNSLLWVPKKS